MKVKPKDLDFLSIYKIVKDSSPLGNKLRIEVKNGNVRYSQKTELSFLTTEKDNSDITEEFELLIDLQSFTDFISSVGKEEEIEVSKTGVSLSKDNHYNFENFTLAFPNVTDILKMVEDSKLTSTSLVIKEVDKLNVIKQFVGKDTLETVALLKGKLLSTDRMKIAYTSTDLVSQENYFLSKQAIDLIKSETELFLSDKFYYFNVNEVLCIFNWKEYKVPDLLSPNAYANFNQTNHVIVDKTKLLQVLTRMNFFVTNNENNRIFLTVNSDNLLIENRDFNKSHDKVELKTSDTSLNGLVFIISCPNMISIVKQLQGSDIYLYFNPDEASRKTVRIEDENHNFIFVHSRLKQQ